MAQNLPGTGAHSPEETLDVPSIERATIRDARLIYRLTRPWKKTRRTPFGAVFEPFLLRKARQCWSLLF